MNNKNNNQNYYYGNQNNRQNGQYYNGNNNYPNQNMNYNNQYYNQNMQNQQMNKQGNKFIDPNLLKGKEKKKKINFNKNFIKKGIIILGAILFVVIGFLLIKSCSKNDDVVVGENEKRVGNADYGYVTIPKDWVNLKDANSSSGLKYSDVDVTYAVTLDYSKSLNAHDFANTAKSQLESAGVTNVEITDTTLNNYDAYKLTGYHEGSQIWVLVYFFDGTDDIAHYVGIEGHDNTNEYFKIPESFRIDK